MKCGFLRIISRHILTVKDGRIITHQLFLGESLAIRLRALAARLSCLTTSLGRASDVSDPGWVLLVSIDDFRAF